MHHRDGARIVAALDRHLPHAHGAVARLEGNPRAQVRGLDGEELGRAFGEAVRPASAGVLFGTLAAFALAVWLARKVVAGRKPADARGWATPCSADPGRRR